MRQVLGPGDRLFLFSDVFPERQVVGDGAVGAAPRRRQQHWIILVRDPARNVSCDPCRFQMIRIDSAPKHGLEQPEIAQTAIEED